METPVISIALGDTLDQRGKDREAWENQESRDNSEPINGANNASHVSKKRGAKIVVNGDFCKHA